MEKRISTYDYSFLAIASCLLVLIIAGFIL